MSAGRPRGAWRFFASVQVIAILVTALTTVSAAAQALEGAHIISGPSVERISGSTVTVLWVTDKAKEGLVKWGNRKGHYSYKIKESVASTHHTLTLSALAQNTTYHYKVKTGIARLWDRFMLFRIRK